MLSNSLLRSFILESNDIEGIKTNPDIEVPSYKRLLETDSPTVADVTEFVGDILCGYRRYQPLRNRRGMNVRVGKHEPPGGGPQIEAALETLLREIRSKPPLVFHHEYETLHPYIDGNGRSGRVLWLWQQLHNFTYIRRGFLTQYYYETLAAVQSRAFDAALQAGPVSGVLMPMTQDGLGAIDPKDDAPPH